jgi:GDP/UDP-N,N'-diacetylbacillosamine 2-epimerase (hydrolysing)
MKRKICVITGTRAEYGLLRWVMQGIKDDSDLELQIIVTGMHLSPIFGLTYKEIEKDGFQIDYRVEVIGEFDSAIGISESIAKGVQGCAHALSDLKPDLVVLLGDRFEIFAAATAAMVARIPIAHIHGGESTEGLIDEAFRHSITKMSQIHFVAAPEYRDRVIQLGESPKNVFLVGGLGLDNIKQLRLLGKGALEDAIGIKFNSRNLLVTFHPVTLEKETAEQQMNEILEALSGLHDTTLIFTLPNADTGGRIIIKMIEEFVGCTPNAYSFKSLGQLHYLSCLQYIDGVLGNSSSGLIEVPSFKKGTINVGDRQLGRLKAKSVIDCKPSRAEINRALEVLYSQDFQFKLTNVINPYGNGGASNKVLEVLRSIDLFELVKKKFNRLETL